MKKSLAKNSLYNVIYKTFNVLFPLISAAYIARILSVEGIGKVAAAQNIAQYFMIVAALGLGSYGTRSIAKTTDQNDLNKCFSELFIINFISTTVCVFAYYTMIYTFDFFYKDRLLYFVTGISIVLNYFNVDWFYQGKEEYGYIMIRSILIKLISLILLFLFIKDKSDYILYSFITCLATAGNYIFNMIHLKKYVSFCLYRLNFIKHLKKIFILLSSSIAIELYTMLDTTMLNIIQNEIEVGYYTNAVKIIRMVANCIIAIGAVALPRLSYFYINEKKEEFYYTCQSIFKTLLLFAIPASIGLFILSDDIVLVLFGNSFFDSILTIRILSILIVVFAIAGGYSAQILISRGDEQLYLYSVISGAVVNIILNSFLIPHFMHNGAAVASIIAEITVLCVQIYFVRDTLIHKIDFKHLFSIIIASMCMLFSIIMIINFKFSIIVELIVSILIGVGIYFLVCLILKNDQVIAMKNKILKYFS